MHKISESHTTEQLHCFSILSWGFPHSSVGKESSCNAGDPGSFPGLGRSTREGIGYPLQYSWASLVAQLIKNLPSMWKTWAWSLGWEDPLEKLPTPVFWTRVPWTVTSMGLQRVGHDWATFTFFPISNYIFQSFWTNLRTDFSSQFST